MSSLDTLTVVHLYVTFNKLNFLRIFVSVLERFNDCVLTDVKFTATNVQINYLFLDYYLPLFSRGKYTTK